MDWSVLLPALLGIAGVLVGAYVAARLSRTNAYAAWHRDHLFDLYVELIPILRLIDALPDTDWERAPEVTRLGAPYKELGRLMFRAEFLCTDETFSEIQMLYKAIGIPWWIDDRQEYTRKRILGSRSATHQRVNNVKNGLETALRAEKMTSKRWTHDNFIRSTLRWQQKWSRRRTRSNSEGSDDSQDR
jgi:hypothetical protein